MTVVVMVPALTALAFAGLRIQAEFTAAEDFNRMVSQVDTSMLITEVVHQLQTERGTVSAAVADGSITLPDTTDGLYRQTDAAISELRDKIGSLELADDTDSKARYNYAFNKLGQLASLRDLAESSTYPDLSVLSAYNAVVDPLVQLGREVTTAGNSAGRSPSRLAAAVQTISQAKEHASQLDALLMVSAVRNNFGSTTVQNQAEAAAAGFDASIDEFVAVATPDEQQRYNDGYSGSEVDKRRDFGQSALNGSDATAPLDFDRKTLRDASNAANDKLRGVETNFIASLRTQASDLASEATATAWQVVLIVIGAMLVALVLMLAMAQSLVNPLRRLRRGALKVANVTLPTTIERILADPNPVEAAKNAVAPMPVDTSEEVGQVARSFDVVHERAVRLATEQAMLRDNVNDMFVNLSRRTQALVERQLSELDKLEQNERDPDQLAQFFVLDHLAARMRRNSENLLILSGVGVARRSSKPVPVNEVIGAAQSEIESYPRVVIKSGPDTLVQGRVVNDVAHLLAELLDNATKFSAADTKVTVTSTHVRSGELAIQISDRGLGLSDDELADINGRLTDPPPFDLAVSRRMGLYVVARLAKRHDIKVRLHGEFNSGTSAVVVLPKKLTAGMTPGDGPQTPETAGRMTRARLAGASQPGVHTGVTSVVDTGPTVVGRTTRTGPVTGPTAPVAGPKTDPQAVPGAGQQPAAGPHTGQQPAVGAGSNSGPLPIPGSASTSGPLPLPGTGTNSRMQPASGSTSGPLPIPGSASTSGPLPLPGTGTNSRMRPVSGQNSGPLPLPGTGTNSRMRPVSGQNSGPLPLPGTGTNSRMQPVSGPNAGPETGPQPVADDGSESGTQRLPGNGPQQPGDAGGLTTPVPRPPTVSQPAVPPRSEPAHAAREGLARSPWFQRTVPTSVGGDGKGNGKGNGTTGNGGKGNGKGTKGKPGAKGKGTGRSGGSGRMADPKAVSASTLNWATAGEDGWSAVRRKLGETAQQAKVNDPLPRRTPGSRLVPGSAGERRLTSGDGAEPEPPSQHTADQLRSRLEGYQQGLARGRGEPGPAGQQPEEQ
jgi:signal transduction histidine kinase